MRREREVYTLHWYTHNEVFVVESITSGRTLVHFKKCSSAFVALYIADARGNGTMNFTSVKGLSSKGPKAGSLSACSPCTSVLCQ